MPEEIKREIGACKEEEGDLGSPFDGGGPSRGREGGGGGGWGLGVDAKDG